MNSKFVIYTLIFLFSSLFFWIGSKLFGGGVFGLWSNVFGFIGCFIGIYVWYKFIKDL